MAYERIKVRDGRRYRYLVKGIRINGVVKQKVVKYLGPVKPIYRIKKRKKTNASIYVRHLFEQEKEKLNKALHSSNAFVRDRARILLHSSKKLFPKQIAEKISCEARKVRRVIKEFNKNRLKVLERRKAKGAILKFSKEDRQAILLHFYREPREFGYVFTTWTMPRFRKHLIDNIVVDSISIEKIRSIIKKEGAELKRSKRWQYSPDKKFLKKREQ